jgi:hypothetical protein
MNIRIYNVIVISILLLLIKPNLLAQPQKKANKDTGAWRYEIEAAGIGVQGTYLVKVWSYSKNKNVAMEQCKKNAVHGIIFKGFTGNDQLRTSQKPLVTNPALELEKADFFRSFFENGGKYMKFVSVSGDAVCDVVRVGKEYKVGVIMSVNVGELRKDLEAAGIIKGLSTGF